MGKRRPGAPWIVLAVLMALSIALLSARPLAAASADDSVKDSFRKMGKAVGKAGKEVGKSAAEAGKAVGRESQKIWYRGVRVSKPALEKAKEETRRAIRKNMR